MSRSEHSSNLYPIKFTKSPEPSNRYDDISQLFENAEDESSEPGKERMARCSSWFGESELLVYRLFYFFFHAATALFAYLPLYYKNSLLLDHHHVGILMGIRPFCGFLGAPILGKFADKFNKYKATLYTGLLSYIIVYLSITFVNGVPKDCDAQARGNHTNTTRVNAKQFNGRHLISPAITASKFLRANSQKRTKSSMKIYNQENLAEGLANIIIQRYEANQNNKQSRSLSRPESSKIAGKDERREVWEKPLYFIENLKKSPEELVKLLQVVSVHEKDSDEGDKVKGDPTHGHGDFQMNTVTADNLTEETDEYDKYWQYGPEIAGEDTWPIDVYRKEPRESNPIEKNKIRNHIFLILLLLMLTAELIGSPILSLADTATLQTLKKEPYRYGRQVIWAAVGFGFMSIITGSVLHYTVSEKDEIKKCPEKMGERYRLVFYSCCALLLIAFFTTFKFKFRTYEGKQANICSFFYCINYFRNVEYFLFAFLAFFTGLGAGLTESFLFVHLIRLGATPLVLVVTTTVQSVSKVIFLYFSPTLILKYGYFSVIFAGMLTSVVTFLYYSFLVSPWMVVPIELLSGLSNSCVWAALVSYVGAPPKIGATLQGIVHSLHIGLGRGIGGLFGGMILLHYGFDVLFRSFSLIIVLVVIVLVLVRYRRKEEVEPIWAKLWDYSPVAPYETFTDEE